MLWEPFTPTVLPTLCRSFQNFNTSSKHSQLQDSILSISCQKLISSFKSPTIALPTATKDSKVPKLFLAGNFSTALPHSLIVNYGTVPSSLICTLWLPRLLFLFALSFSFFFLNSPFSFLFQFLFFAQGRIAPHFQSLPTILFRALVSALLLHHTSLSIAPYAPTEMQNPVQLSFFTYRVCPFFLHRLFASFLCKFCCSALLSFASPPRYLASLLLLSRPLGRSLSSFTFSNSTKFLLSLPLVQFLASFFTLQCF